MAEGTQSQNIIVLGLGHVGFRVVGLLRRLGLRPSVVTQATRSEWQRWIDERKIPLAVGDARDEALILRMGLANAAALIAATNSDEVNLETALDARAARPDIPLVLRLFDSNLARGLEQTLGRARAFGASFVAGPQLAWAALGEDVIAIVEHLGASHVLARLGAGDRERLANLSPTAIRERFGMVMLGEEGAKGESLVLADTAQFARFRNLGLSQRASQVRTSRAGSNSANSAQTGESRSLSVRRLIREIWKQAPRALRRALLILLGLVVLSVAIFGVGLKLDAVDALYYVITTVTTVGYGDITPKDSSALLKIYACLLMIIGSSIMGLASSLVTNFLVGERMRAILEDRSVRAKDHVIVVGVGRVGYRTVLELNRIGVPVVAIDQAVNEPLSQSLRHLHIPLVNGDGRLEDTLESAHLAEARAIIAATGDDAVNLAVVLAAKRMKASVRTVTRLFDPDFAVKIERAGLAHVAVSSSRAAAPVFVASAIYTGVKAALVDDEGLLAVCETDGGAPGELTLRRRAFVAESA